MVVRLAAGESRWELKMGDSSDTLGEGRRRNQRRIPK
jgi:hypothetical protein